MKSVKKALVMILTLAMLLSMLAACGGNNNSSSAESSGSESSAPATAGADNASTGDTNTESAGAADNAGQTDAGGNAGAGTVDKSFKVGTMYSHLYFYTAGAGESDNYSRRLIYDQIFYIDDNTGERTSSILSGYEWEDDYTLRLDLKDGVIFSDGSQMTGEDILYTLQCYIDNGNSEFEFFQRIDFDKSHVGEDGLTTYIVYREVYGAALSTLCIPVLSKAFGEAHPDGDDVWWYSPVGSGPYEVGTVVMGTSVEYVLREDYWDKSAGYEAETVTVKYYSDNTAMYADYVAGELDAILGLLNSQVDQLSTLSNTKVVVQSANDVLLLAFNANSVQPEVREAIAYAVDWDAVGVAAFGNLCSPATSHFATTFEAYTNHGKVYEYNPDKARQILEDAGISGLSFKFPCFSGDPTDGAVGEAVQFYLAEIGISLIIEPMDIPTLVPTLITGGGDICMQSTVSGGNAPKEVNTVVSPLASDGFAMMAIPDPEFNDLLAQGLNTTDSARRAEIYKQIDQWLYDNYQVIPVCERAEAFCYNTEKLASMSVASIQRGGIANVTFK